MSDTQVRSYQTELRAVQEDGRRTIEGYACLYNVVATYPLRGPRGLFRERFAPGCFDDSIGVDNIGVYFDHKTQLILGRTRNQTATIKSDDKGVFFSCELPDTSYANDLVSLIERGDIYGCSIGFRDFVYEWSPDEDGVLIGTVTKAHLFDVGPVSMPVYDTTSVGLRSLETYIHDQEEQKNHEWQDVAARRLRMQMQKLKA